MSAGLPGVGLSGIFFILSALAMLPLELVRTARGRSSVARWSQVLRNLAIAATMIVGLFVAYALLQLALSQLGIGGAAHGHGTPGGARVRTLPIAPVLATTALIAVLLSAAKLLHLRSHRVHGGIPKAPLEPVASAPRPPLEPTGRFVRPEEPVLEHAHRR